MPTLDIGGVGSVDVGEQFLQLSPDDQRRTVDEIISQVGGGQQQPSMGAGATAADVAKSAGVGAAQGAIGMAGLPGDIEQVSGGLLQRGYKAATGEDAPGWLRDMASPLAIPLLLRRAVGSGAEPDQQALPTSADIRGQVEGVTGKFYQPKTTAGEYARTAGEFVPAAMTPGGGVRGAMRGAAKFGVLPGLASEAAGQATEGTELEPFARAGAALATGGAAALASRPGSAGGILRDAAPNLDDATARAAQSLMDDAARMSAPLTAAEAIQQVTNSGTRLGDVQRVVEQSRRGGPVLREFMAGRPQGTRQAAEDAINGIGPRSGNPSQIGPRVQRAGQAVLDDTRQQINALADPLYSVARQQQIPAAQFRTIAQNPSFAEGLRRVRADPIKGAEIAGLPDNSIAVVDAVKKELDTIGRNASNPMNPDRDMYLAELAGRGRSQAVSAASQASPEYARALQIGRQGRARVLEPVKRGPIGQLSRTDNFKKQAEILLSRDPLPGSEREVRAAVRSVAAFDPAAARDLVRTRIEQVFNEAAQDLASGPNQFGGAKFRGTIAGNAQQAKNLQAVVETVAGRPAWQGLSRALEVFEAQGRRQAVGSQTEFNRLLGEELKRGGIVGYSASLAASPTKIMGAAKGIYEGFRYGRNTEILAQILVDPNAIRRLQNLSMMRSDSPRARAIAAALVINAYGGADRQQQPSTDEADEPGATSPPEFMPRAPIQSPPSFEGVSGDDPRSYGSAP